VVSGKLQVGSGRCGGGPPEGVAENVRALFALAVNRDHDREQKRAMKYGLEILCGTTTLVASNQAPHAMVLC
jgi:hypothetical protein